MNRRTRLSLAGGDSWTMTMTKTSPHKPTLPRRPHSQLGSCSDCGVERERLGERWKEDDGGWASERKREREKGQEEREGGKVIRLRRR